MATKTITLEMDAYEKLRTAKKAGESFSEVVRRAEFANAPATGASLLAYYRDGGSGVSELYLAATALAHGFGVVTNNADEFRRVPRLMVETF
jgi:predicted nucleic acid-binding protein